MLNRGEFPEEQGIGWFPSDKVRLFTNDSRIRFEYPVHELVEPSLKKMQVSIEEFPVAVHHYGTLRETQAQEKIKNYRKLGRNKLRTNCKNAAAVKESAVQSAQLGDYAQAIALWRRFVKLRAKSAEGYLNLGAACWNLERYEEAISFSEKALQLDPHLKEAGFNLAFSMLMTGRAGEAKRILERPFIRQAGYPPAQLLLCVAYTCLKEKAQAESVYERLKALPMGEFIGESLLDITKRFLSASQTDYALLILEAAEGFGCNQDQVMELLRSCNNLG
jgi:tetratricopeptide (TPR) repeat protein